jgi:glycosyltransferase involved in cell wall biosynthesis
MKSPSTTIFIPTYRRPQLLKKAIASALNQTWANLQVVVCDNASKDETGEIVAQFRQTDPRVQYICHSTELGMLGNYQFIFSNVETEFFSILSDDDILLPSFCETALAGFAQFPDIAFFACSTTIIDREKGILRVPLDFWPREGRFEAPEGALQMIGKYPVPLTVLFRTKMASAATIDFQNEVAWDCDYLIQLAAHFPIAISKKPTGVFFSHPNSFTRGQTVLATLTSIKRIKERVASFSWIETSSRNALQELIEDDCRNVKRGLVLSHLARRRFKEAKEEAHNLFSQHPFKPKHLFFWLAITAIIFLPPIRLIFVILLKIRQLSRRWQLASLRQRTSSLFFLFVVILFFNFS